MVEITYMPWKKFVLHEVIEQSNKQFFEWFMEEALSQSNITPSVPWSNGVAFVVSNFMETPETVREKLNGVIHYASVNFTKIGFQATFPVTMKDLSKYSVSLIMSENPDFQELTLWLRKWEKPRSSPTS
jgi:hypothetical protein